MYVNTHLCLANCAYGHVELWYWYRATWVAFRVRVLFQAEVAFRAEVVTGLEWAICIGRVEVHMFLPIASLSADSVPCDVGEHGILPCGLTKHSQVSMHSGLNLFMPMILSTWLRLFLDFGVWGYHQTFHFMYCVTLKPAVCRFGHISGQAQIGRFQLYPTAFSCESNRHDGDRKEISCCF
jgi:hypothetical protein